MCILISTFNAARVIFVDNRNSCCDSDIQDHIWYICNVCKGSRMASYCNWLVYVSLNSYSQMFLRISLNPLDVILTHRQSILGKLQFSAYLWLIQRGWPYSMHCPWFWRSTLIFIPMSLLVLGNSNFSSNLLIVKVPRGGYYIGDIEGISSFYSGNNRFIQFTNIC